MTLVTCSHSEHAASSNAQACPSCGNPTVKVDAGSVVRLAPRAGRGHDKPGAPRCRTAPGLTRRCLLRMLRQHAEPAVLAHHDGQFGVTAPGLLWPPRSPGSPSASLAL